MEKKYVIISKGLKLKVLKTLLEENLVFDENVDLSIYSTDSPTRFIVCFPNKLSSSAVFIDSYESLITEAKKGEFKAWFEADDNIWGLQQGREYMIISAKNDNKDVIPLVVDEENHCFFDWINDDDEDNVDKEEDKFIDEKPDIERTCYHKTDKYTETFHRCHLPQLAACDSMHFEASEDNIVGDAFACSFAIVIIPMYLLQEYLDERINKKVSKFISETAACIWTALLFMVGAYGLGWFTEKGFLMTTGFGPLIEFAIISILLSIIARLAFLKKYPFKSLGDFLIDVLLLAILCGYCFAVFCFVYFGIKQITA